MSDSEESVDNVVHDPNGANDSDNNVPPIIVDPENEVIVQMDAENDEAEENINENADNDGEGEGADVNNVPPPYLPIHIMDLLPLVGNEIQQYELDEDEDDQENDPNENVQNDFFFHDEHDNDHHWEEDSVENDEEDDDEDNESTRDEDDSVPILPFDRQLPMQHSYLGEAMEELQGRVVLDDDSILEIPIVAMNLHLIPGQILPMAIHHAAFQNAIRRCIVNERLFGIVNNGMDYPGGLVSRGALGTMAEIYEFQEERDAPNPLQVDFSNSFAIKAKGRQRFNVLELRRQADGNLMAKVRIRPEVRLPSLWSEMCFSGTMRYKFPILIPAELISKAPKVTDSITSNPNPNPTNETDELGQESSNGGPVDSDKEDEMALPRLVAENRTRRSIARYYSVFTPWPAFVHENYDEKLLVERIHRKLKNELQGLTGTGSRAVVPFDGTELSFWLAQNLTMDDSIRLQILKLDCPIQRLRFELSLLENVTRTIGCRQCLTPVANWADIFSMSVEGPQGTYVNPNGFVHETLTLNNVVSRDLITHGLPSTEASWFPGYSWIIVECRRCRQHLGWRFDATGRMKPMKFWGLSRRSVTFKYNFTSETCGGNLDLRRPSTSSSVRSTVSVSEVGEADQNIPPPTPPNP